MIPYWLMFVFVAGLALRLDPNKHKDLKLWAFIGLLFTLLIGFRFEVGGDWFNYLRHYNLEAHLALDIRILKGGDPGYVFLNWLMAYWGVGIEGVNLISATIFVSGLVLFCYQQERPLLAFSIAIPYLIIVVAMGYTRQGIAIGLFLGATSYLEKGSFKTYIALLVIAAFFHKTAVLLIPLGLFLYGKGRIVRLVSVALIAFGVWDLLLAEKQDDLWKNYVDAKMISEGAKIRVFMNVIPAVLFLYYRRRWEKLFPNYWFWFWIAVASLACVPLVGIASTAVDRVALYLIPIQIAVFSRLPRLASDRFNTGYVIFAVVLGYAAVMFVWLNYGSHAKYWIPYQNILFL